MAEAPDPLAELKDIHLPAPPDLWPPAPGWWLLGIATALLVAYGLYVLYNLWRANAYRREAITELDSYFANERSEDKQLLTSVNALLKRVALSRFPRMDVAKLSGESWVAFLDSKIPGHDFTMGPGQVLIDGPYAETVAPVNRAALHQLARNWIKQHREVQHD